MTHNLQNLTHTTLVPAEGLLPGICRHHFRADCCAIAKALQWACTKRFLDIGHFCGKPEFLAYFQCLPRKSKA
jgi:hypothetical protein